MRVKLRADAGSYLKFNRVASGINAEGVASQSPGLAALSAAYPGVQVAAEFQP